MNKSRTKDLFVEVSDEKFTIQIFYSAILLYYNVCYFTRKWEGEKMCERVFMKSNIFWKKKPYGSLLYDIYDFPGRMKLNETGTYFISYVDGKHSISDIAQKASEEFAADFDVILNDCQDFFNLLLQKDWITFDQSTGKPVAPEQLEPNIELVSMRVTNRCNFKCIHCFPNSESVTEDEMTTEEIMALMDELAKFKPLHITLTGGEPFLRPDFLDLVEYANSKGMLVSLCTNGSLVDEEAIERLQKCALASLKISMDGATAEIHDKYRGKGKFARLIPKIKQMVAAGLPVCINSVISRVNFHEYRKLYELAQELGVYEFAYDYVRKMGRAKENWDDVALSMDEQIEFISYYTSLASSPEPQKVAIGSVFHTSILGELINPVSVKKACNSCLSTVVILADGTTTPCWRLYDGMGYVDGNIRQRSFTDIWQNGELLQKIRHLEIDQIEKCRDCQYNQLCDASCRAWALPIHGDWYGAPNEERCLQRQILFSKY